MKLRYYLSFLLLWLAVLPVTAGIEKAGGNIRGTVALPKDATGNTTKAIVVAYGLPPAVIKTRVEVLPDGTYELKDLPEGLYYVYATANNIQQFYGGGTTEGESKPIEVKEGSVTDGVNFDFNNVIISPPPPPPMGNGVIKGRITDPAGQPIEYAKVTVQDPQVGYWGGSPSDANGEYVLSGLPEGTFIVQAWADRYSASYYRKGDDPRGFSPVSLGKDETVSGIDITMQLPGQISGRVIDVSGNPIPGIEVSAISKSRLTWNWGGSTTTTNEKGEYVLSALEPDDYYVQVVVQDLAVTLWYPNAKDVAQATPVTVSNGSEAKDINFKLDVRYMYGSAKGKVTTKEGTPVSAGYVTLSPINAENTGRGMYSTKLEPDGTFRFDRVLAGTYQLTVQVLTSNWGQLASINYPNPITITENTETNGLTIEIASMNGRISGVVKDKNGNPILQAGVIAESTDPIAQTRIYVQTDPDGKFVMNNLPDGDYLLSVSACISFTCAYIWYKQAETPEDATLIKVVNGISIPEIIEFKLPIAKGTAVVSGIVTDKNGNPLPYANISLFNNQKPDPTGSATGTNTTRAMVGGYTNTDENGQFVIKEIPEGEYHLFTSWYGEGGIMAEAWYDGKKDLTEATAIVLAVNEVRDNLKVVLDPKPIFGAVVGTITTKDGKPIQDALVELKPANTEGMDWMFFKMMSFQQTTRTDENGRFVFDQVFRGEYEVAAFADGIRMYSGNATNPEDAVAIVVEGGVKTPVELIAIPQRLTGKGILSGWVVNENRLPVENSLVTLTNARTDEVFTALPKKDGSFRIAGLPDGAYLLKAQAPYHMPMYFKNTWDPAQAEVIRIDNDQPTMEGVVLKLHGVYYRWLDTNGNINKSPAEANTSARITGRVLAVTGEAVAGASVYVMDEAGEPISMTTTQKDGTFQIADLSAGSQLRVYASKHGYKGQYQDGANSLAQNQPIQLTNGSRQFDFVLTPADASVNREEETTPLPNGLTVQQAFPNPFSTSTTLRFTVGTSEKVQISVYDLTGRRLNLLSDELRAAGSHEVRWQPDNNLPNGLYFYRIETERTAQTGKMVLMR